jgi:hypothetical protein
MTCVESVMAMAFAVLDAMVSPTVVATMINVVSVMATI